ncbi:unnamed protein product [Rotaria sp. Silwood2]|nr:unnamed protein product [Rotaria sp. Silwood2]CAF2715826.1 unnamed protein product [Rotaria sp. Silwood2]
MDLTGKLLQDLSQLSYSREHYNELMGMLWKRCFTQDKRLWRRTYKVCFICLPLILLSAHTRKNQFDTDLNLVRVNISLNVKKTTTAGNAIAII